MVKKRNSRSGNIETVRGVGRYALALLFVAAAALLRWALPGVLGPTPFLAFYLAWVGAAAFGGLGPGLLATGASWLCLEVLFNFTPGQTLFSDRAELGRFVVLMAGGLTVSLVAERMRRGRTREREQAGALTWAKRALERERDILQAVMDGAKNSHLVYLDRDFNFVRVNTTYAQTCGYRPEEMIGRNHFALYPHAENEAIFARVRTTGEPFEVHDKPFVFPDQPQRGVTYWDWTLLPIKDSAGQVEGLVFSLYETTERKRAEEAVRQANEQLQQQAEELQAQKEELQTQTEELQAQTEELGHTNAALRESEKGERRRVEELATFLEAAPTPVIIVHDPNGVHMTGNRAADELLCHPRGAEISLSAPPETRPRHFKAVKGGRELRLDELPAQRAARGEQVRDFEFSLVFNDGTTRHLLGYGTPLRDEGGRPRGAVHILVDITERRRAEEALRELAATLESKVAQRTAQLKHRAQQLQKLTLEISEAEDRERKRLAEILHDDLQQIIAAAKFHLSLIRNRVKHDASVQSIVAQIDEMLKEAIDKSRGLSHELSPAVRYQGGFAEALDRLANQMQTKHGFTVQVQATGQVHLHSDAIGAFLYRTAQELLFNAVKHAQVKEAGIRVRRLGRFLCLTVSDHGRGFDPRELRETTGFGLLSIRERIELLGGRMRIRSAKGKGSTFFIAVPDGETAAPEPVHGTTPDREPGP